ncbi:MAG: IS66 family transposase, partial [Bryobacteraceae bacterium]
QEPEGVGAEKYDETVASMVAQLKYGSGMPFRRLEDLEKRLGIPLPASTQWEIAEEAAELIKPARDELIRQAAEGEVVHNDDTAMKVLKLERPPTEERTGVFTSGIVSVGPGHRVALFFTGRQHAGENLADVLKQRVATASVVQMCDALSRNPAKPNSDVEILLANCLAHGRRQFVEIAGNFRKSAGTCWRRSVLCITTTRWLNSWGCRQSSVLRFHQERSAPLMEDLHQWLETQLAQHKVEPNSGLGRAITYLLRHWKPLTLFLRQVGAPLDNNLWERALKKAVLHRKNALFYRTMKGAEVGDLFMTLIHTCELNGVNSFDYLIELQRHATELAAKPADWMPWNYRTTLSNADTK